MELYGPGLKVKRSKAICDAWSKSVMEKSDRDTLIINSQFFKLPWKKVTEIQPPSIINSQFFKLPDLLH